MRCYFRVKKDGVCMIYEGGIKEIKRKGGNDMAGNKTESLFYSAEEVSKMMGLCKTKGYAFLDKTMAIGKPFVVIRVDKLYRIPKESFNSWIKQLNQAAQD